VSTEEFDADEFDDDVEQPAAEGEENEATLDDEAD
jgi:hypothetical protein